MKHQPAIILASLLMLASACSRDFDGDDMPVSAPEPEQEQGYAVPVEQALKSLDNELAMIYGDEDTRAAQPRRRVKAVHNVSYNDVAPATRSAEMPDDVADLFYIVEFADGQGSAVLGADKRVEPVLAILDETVLTPEDFAAADIGSDDITSYMAALMIDGVVNDFSISLDTSGYDKPLPIDKFWGPGRDTLFCKQAPMLRTKWDQYSPFNDLYTTVNSNRYPAGCGVIAVAQILAHNKSPEIVSLSGINIDWNILDKFRYGYYYPITDSDREYIATVIYNIGRLMNMQHIQNGTNLSTSTNISNAVSALRTFSYKQVSSQQYTSFATRNMILNKHLPIFIRGEELNRAASGHAWVIDGWNEYTVRYWNCYYDTHGGTDMEILDRVLLSSRTYTKMHCNFGWGGLCDGYYSENLFDTTKRLSTEDIDRLAGDYAGIGGYVFNNNFKIITYSL